MKKFLLFLVLNFSFLFSKAKHVDVNFAKTIAQNFYFKKVDNSSKKDLILNYISSEYNGISKSYDTLFYVFNFDKSGYVMISADDVILPVLSYSTESKFDINELPPDFKKWIEGYKYQIRYAINNKLKSNDEIDKIWNGYIDSNLNIYNKTTSVSPLIQTSWNQLQYYNSLCPINTPTGCVATAMAQIMKYWNYPNKGFGFHSYQHPNYGILSANFGNTTYQWSSMPNVVSSPNNSVATLMYHCGVSVNMNYTTGSQGSCASVLSIQNPNSAENALKTYFGYKTSLQGIQKINYTDAQWLSLIKNELDIGRPIIYAGCGNINSGHCFIADGYDNNDYIHFNWGWGGSGNNYCYINSLIPNLTSSNFSYLQQAIIGIEPPANLQSYNLKLYANIIPSSSSIPYGNAFSISTNIWNSGSNNFNGDYCAAIFDNQLNFVDYIQTLTNYNLPSNNVYTNNLTFNSNGIYSMIPGNYYVGVFFRPTGGTWSLVQNNSTFTNLVPISVVNTNSISLYSTINITPSSFIQNQSGSINLDIVNNGNSTFYGQYRVSLYNLDGTFAQSISTINASSGLPASYHYNSPYLTFSNNITVAPGTYLVALEHKSNTNPNWELTGSTSSYINPTKVVVTPPILQPDQYEINNYFSQSYNLPVFFNSGIASVLSLGSNFHVGTDNDYYKINLNPGYDYFVTARLHDSYNSANGNVYSADGLFSYSFDGLNWSTTYDDVMPNNIYLSNGGNLFFHVAPYFSGFTGTYLLDILVSQIPNNVKNLNVNDGIIIYPNPCFDILNIKNLDNSNDIKKVTIYNTSGQLKFEKHFNKESDIKISFFDFAKGVYFVEIDTDSGVLNKKVVVN